MPVSNHSSQHPPKYWTFGQRPLADAMSRFSMNRNFTINFLNAPTDGIQITSGDLGDVVGKMSPLRGALDKQTSRVNTRFEPGVNQKCNLPGGEFRVLLSIS